MIQSEAQLEQQFLEKLQEMKYTYRSDIRDLDALESNFRQKFERLNFVTLSDDEFRKLLQENVTADVFTASKRLREKQTFTRNDGTTFDYSLVNLRDWCKNDYEVVTSSLSIPPIVASATTSSSWSCLLYTSPSPRDGATSRMPSSA